MKTRFPLFLFALALLGTTVFVACDDDDDGPGPAENGSVNVNFIAEYAGNDLAIQSETYDYPDGSDLKVQLFQYFVSDLELIPADGGENVLLSDILLVRYDNAQDDNRDQYQFADVPAGEYSGIRYGLGVSPDLNNQPPSAYPADFVLNESEYWNDNVRYVFAKIEANVDLENDGTFDTPVSYHLGNNSIYTTIEFTAPITVSPNDATTLDLTADVRDALAENSTTFQDFSDENQRIVHGGNQAVAADIWTRLTNQFILSVR